MSFGENRKIRIVAAVIVICVSLVPSIACANGDRVAVIGFAARLTDAITNSPRDAAQMAIEEANQQAEKTAGSIRFSLSLQNDQGNPNLSVFIANYFVKANVVGVIGHWHSVTTLAAAQTYEAAHVSQINITTTNSQITKLGYQGAFRDVGGTDDLSRSLAETAVNTMHGKHIVIIGNDSGYSKALTESIASEIAKRSPNIPQSLSVSAQTADFNTVLTSEVNKQADLIIFTGYVTQVEDFVNAVKRLGIKTNIIFNEGATNLQLPDEDNSNIYAYEPEIAQDKCPRWKTFYQKFQRRYGYIPNTYAGNAYNAAGMLIEAVRQTNSTDAAKVTAYLHQLHYKGLAGELAFAPGGALLNPTYTVFHAERKNWQPMHFFSADKKIVKDCFKD